ncbi:MAG: glycosyltransferase family 2 protein [Bacteroidota bacterium]
MDILESTYKFPKITVVTPNYNQVNFIEFTIQSVLNQDYPNLEYIIIDGGSTDGSIEIIKKYENKLHSWVSEPDNGMYDAINKGFSKSSGEIMCWINSDDVLWENSLQFVANAFATNLQVQWLQGFPSVIDENGIVTYQREPIYSKFNFYLFNHLKNFSFIQQESTFWKRELWEKAGGYLSLEYQLASDFDLWMRFFNSGEMYCTKTQLGAFRIREGQKSSDKTLYLKEAKISLFNNYKKLKFKDRLIIQVLVLFEKLKDRTNTKIMRRCNNKMQSFIIGQPKMIS